MSLVIQSPCWGDSNSMLIWKYAVNLHLAAVAINPALQPPRLGSPDNENWANALSSLLVLS